MAGGLLYDLRCPIADAQDSVCLRSSEGPERELQSALAAPRIAERPKSNS